MKMKSLTEMNLKFSNCSNMRVNTNINKAIRLIAFGLNNSVIQVLTDIDRKKVGNLRRQMIENDIIDEPQAPRREGRNISDFLNTNSSYVYFRNELLLLYVLLHSSDPTLEIDTNAFLQAWCLMYNFRPDIINKANINDAFQLTQYFLKKYTDKSKDDPDFKSIFLRYSNNYKSYYLYVTDKDKTLDDSGYIKLTPLKKIAEDFRRKNYSNIKASNDKIA